MLPPLVVLLGRPYLKSLTINNTRTGTFGFFVLHPVEAHHLSPYNSPSLTDLNLNGNIVTM